MGIAWRFKWVAKIAYGRGKCPGMHAYTGNGSFWDWIWMVDS